MTQPQDPSAEGQRVFNLAREAAERGEYALAAQLYSRLTGNPDPNLHVAALLGLADARYRLDDEEGALQAWIVATQGPETPITWQAWVALAGARVRQGDLVGATRSYREAARRAPPDEQPQIASRLGWLNKEMGNTGAAGRYFSRARGAFVPYATWAIVALTAAVSLFIDFSPSAEPLFDLLALDKQKVMAGEYWRLITVALVHSPTFPVALLHLGFNMYALFIVGPIVEALYGRVLFVAFYLIAAIGGSIGSYLFVPGPSVGASGAVFGLFGLLFLSTYIHKPLLGRQARALTSQIGMLIVVNLIFGFTLGGTIDNAAHVGGLVTGAWLGYFVAPRGSATISSLWQRLPQAAASARERYSGVIAVGGVALLIAIQVIALNVRPFWA
jgi:membrane associated rhomboid family serine protease